MAGWLKLVCHDSYEISFKCLPRVKYRVMDYSNIFERREQIKQKAIAAVSLQCEDDLYAYIDS